MVTKSLKEKMTPYDKWYDRKPNLAHLRCMAYAYVPDNNRRRKLKSFDSLGIAIRLKGTA